MLEFILPAALSLFGASSKSKAIKEANDANLPSNQVKEWEKAGINPLVGITQGQWISQNANTAIGDAFLETGLSATQTAIQHRNAEGLQETQLKHEKQLLEKRLKALERNQEPTNMEKYGALIPIGRRNAYTSFDHASVSSNSASTLSNAVRVESRDLASPFGVIDVDETVDPAEKFEEEYGEVGAEVVGATKLFKDGTSSLADHYDNQVSAFPDEPYWKLMSWGWGGNAQHRPKARPDYVQIGTAIKVPDPAQVRPPYHMSLENAHGSQYYR